MDTSTGARRGKVADRVRVSQDVQQLQTRIPSLHLPPPVLTYHPKPAIHSEYDANNNLTTTSSTECVRGDASEDDHHDRPAAVNTISYHDVRDLKRLRDKDNELFDLPLRPFTSLDGPSEQQTSTNSRTQSQAGRRPGRRQHSADYAIGDPALEITIARSRLRPVIPKKQPTQDVPEPPPGRALTMDDLNDMLDDAIQNSSPKTVPPSDERVNLAPKPGFVLRRASTRLGRLRSQSRARPARDTPESVEPRTSEDSVRVQYLNEEPQTHRQKFNQQDVVKHEERFDPESPSSPPPKSVASTELSPVKQRAAIFEQLTRQAKPVGHGNACQHFEHEPEPETERIHYHPGSPHRAPRKVHRIKFGDRIEERPAIPLIPLTLPTLVTKEKTTRPPSAIEDRQENKEAVEASVEEPKAEDNSKKEITEKVHPAGWPFKWGFFNKGSTAAPQETLPLVSDNGAKDEHYPAARPSMVRGKVKDILQAAEKQREAEQRLQDSGESHGSRRHTRAPPFRWSIGPNRADSKVENKDEQAPSESATKEEQQDNQSIAIVEANTKSPLQRAMSEKQVLAPPPPIEQDDTAPDSPQKSLPQTPVRGRPRFSRQATPEQKHSVERQFNLSPTRSMSRHRQGVKVEVEIRDSPERDARERGEKIVIIRADVASDMGDEGN